MPRNIAIAWITGLFIAIAVPLPRGVAAPVQFTMRPGPVKLGFRAYGLGLLRIDGQFTRFSGALTLDGANPGFCSVNLHAEAASLQMPQQAMTDDALGPDLLDAVHFPDFIVEGRCDGGALRGMMVLHGISRPILLAVSLGPESWTAVGTIRRADWGMSARPLLAGPEVQVTISAGLPPGFAR